jgi:long-chain acyl-CoA synthetase
VIANLLRQQARHRPESPFVITPTQTITFLDMLELVEAAKDRLRQAISPGARVMVLCGNRPAFLVAWFAINDLGGIAVPVNTSLGGDGLLRLAAQSGSTVLVAEPDFLAKNGSVLEALFEPSATVIVDGDFERTPGHGSPRASTEAVLTPELGTPSTILYTSGTTGQPKGAVIPLGAYLQAADDMVASSGLTADDRIMVCLPLYHANPQMYAVLPALKCGAAVILLPRFSASRFFDQARTFGATAFTYVGTILKILLAHHPAEVRDHALRWCVGGGAPKEVWEAIEGRFNVKVRELYGMTETGGWVSMNTPWATAIGSVGAPRPGVDIAILDDQRRPVPVSTTGEIAVRSSRPYLFFAEYWRDIEATESIHHDSWLLTGDLGSLDANGFLYFSGRKKDLIRRAGEMISPVEIEEGLLRHSAVAECVVTSLPHDVLDEEIVAAVVARHPVTQHELQDFLGRSLPGFMIPEYITFVTEIPKTETTKVKRFEVAERIGRERAGQTRHDGYVE